MNKRQIKKRKKILNERYNFFNQHIILDGRRSGKTYMIKAIQKACISKKYKYFKALKKAYNKIFITVDISSGKDYSVMNTCRVIKGNVVKVLKSEMINKE